ncbi:hypothetical protein [Lentilactobacillus hilgardii]|uniref:hypothetical protein n=1 Tax=Lentilactobacillus hilgardii TaxID=1588 RepID=UPI0021A3D9A2|nr:hypothetical protein [Lentilactobacillus hilgardii]MCP9334480.1 hypothetical protein [Lentilactobacillus hilgardii]MCP9351080.1 hypothetical protein [Lentilactobacillus hilgardii]MCP9353920.1 hypothetical protein [Lentilactobacillus hilgardii]MCT3397568.1 hypothetical protein [Lentilactobacillus hilgardii]
MIVSGQAQRKKREPFIIFTGDNQDDVQKFLQPLVSHLTKKKHKLQVVTPQGALSVSPQEIVVKENKQRIAVFSQREFEQLFVIVD